MTVYPVRYTKDKAPRVSLKSDPKVIGLLVEEGETQSIVKWPNGNEDCVANNWITKINGPLVLPAQPITSPAAKPGKLNGDVAAGALPLVPAAPPKARKTPDALALRVAGFDDAQLKSFATANDCWQDKYLELPNNGLRRMNVMNRLRAKLKKDPKYKVKWP